MLFTFASDKSIKLFFGTDDQLELIVRKQVEQKRRVLILGGHKFLRGKHFKSVDHVISKEAMSRGLNGYFFGTATFMYDMVIDLLEESFSIPFLANGRKAIYIKRESMSHLLRWLPLVEIKANNFLDIKEYYK